MIRKVAALENASKNQIAKRAMSTCSPPPSRGQKIDIRVTLMKISMGLRYWRNIIPRFIQMDSKYQPSWKFSIIPQKAQKLEIAVDKPTTTQPTIFGLFGSCSIKQILAVRLYYINIASFKLVESLGTILTKHRNQWYSQGIKMA
jgi:hypothetical protein